MQWACKTGRNITDLAIFKVVSRKSAGSMLGVQQLHEQYGDHGKAWHGMKIYMTMSNALHCGDGI